MSVNFILAMVLKPFIALILMGLIVLPIKMLFERIIPEGKVKRILFTRL
jgi:hypothetical protein